MSTPTYKQAVPTAYRGIEFRSKSEAVVARGFDLLGWLWEYEPEFWRTEDGWVPDFLVAWRPPKLNHVFIGCVEYKPCLPTPSYLTQLSKRFSSLGDKLYFVSEIVICGSPFDNSLPRDILERQKDGYIPAPPNFSTRFFQSWSQALEYRFDLKQ